METQADDRRSKRTQQALIQALLELLVFKTYDQITIQDIVDQANVGRSTFYAHFQNKDALLKKGFTSMLDVLVQQISLNENAQGLSLDTTCLFRHARGHYDLYRTLLWGSGFDVLINDGYNVLNQKIQERLAYLIQEKGSHNVPLEVLAAVIAGSLLVLLKWWLDQKMPYPPEQMDAYFQQIVFPGVRGVLKTTQPNEGIIIRFSE